LETPVPAFFLKLIHRSALAALLATVAGAASLAYAQAFPAKPIIVRVAFPAGGSADSGFRQVQPALQQALAQPVVIENLPGAGGSISAMNVLNAPSDGYVLLGTTGSDLTLAPLSIASAKYDSSRFRLIGVIAVTDFVLVSSTAFKFKNIDDLLAHMRSPGSKELSIAHWGRGSSPHLVGADLQLRTGAKFLEVPYKGVAPIIPDLIGGNVDLTFLPLAGPTVGLIKTGKVRAIGVAGKARIAQLPDVPTLNEGRTLRGFEHVIWTGLFASANTPDHALAKLNGTLNEIIKTSSFQRFLEETASRPAVTMDLSQAAAFHRTEAEKISRIAASIKLQPE
jgi:tripartite-type tricarboxylate transporter receptor subunit TctC